MVSQSSGGHVSQSSGQMPLRKAVECQSLHQVISNLHQTILSQVLRKSRGKKCCHVHIDVSASCCCQPQSDVAKYMTHIQSHPDLQRLELVLLGCSLFGRWIADIATFVETHVTPTIKDLTEIPAKLHYPTVSELGWKSGIVLVAMVVLMIVVCTMDSMFVAAMSWYMQRSLWLSSVFNVRRVLAAVYCMTMFGTMYRV